MLEARARPAPLIEHGFQSPVETSMKVCDVAPSQSHPTQMFTSLLIDVIQLTEPVLHYFPDD
jgi:hypothetical protein